MAMFRAICNIDFKYPAHFSKVCVPVGAVVVWGVWAGVWAGGVN